LFGVLRYIHQNPLKTGIYGLSEEHCVNKEFVLSLFHRDLKQGVADFKAFNRLFRTDDCSFFVLGKKAQTTSLV
jgi:hypothetical protein